MGSFGLHIPLILLQACTGINSFAYLIFSLSYPILNNYIASINKEDHKKTIFAGVLIISAGSLLSSIMGVDYLRLHYGDTFIWFLFIYLIIAYIKKYRIEVSKSTAILIWVVPLVIQYASRIIISILSMMLSISKKMVDGTLRLILIQTLKNTLFHLT